MDKFDNIYALACQRKGNPEAVEALLPAPLSSAELGRIADDRYLSWMSRCIFRSGFVWKVVDNKWPHFEAAFLGFDAAKLWAQPDEAWEAKMDNAGIIRNWAKIKSIRENAGYVRKLAIEHGSAAQFFAQWPTDDYVGLLDELKKNGSRLGGNTGQYFLRFIGKDSFILSQDVVRALVAQRVVEKQPNSKKALQQVQVAFNQWAAESGRPLSHISRILALSVD